MHYSLNCIEHLFSGYNHAEVQQVRRSQGSNQMCNFAKHIVHTCASKNHVLMWSWNVLNCPEFCNKRPWMHHAHSVCFTTIYTPIQLSEITNQCEPLFTEHFKHSSIILYLLQVIKLPHEIHWSRTWHILFKSFIAIFVLSIHFNWSTRKSIYSFFSVAVIHKNEIEMNTDFQAPSRHFEQKKTKSVIANQRASWKRSFLYCSCKTTQNIIMIKRQAPK